MTMASQCWRWGGQAGNGVEVSMGNGQNLKELSHAPRAFLRQACKGAVDLRGLNRGRPRLEGSRPGLDAERCQERALGGRPVHVGSLAGGRLGKALEIHMGGEVGL